LDQMSGHRKQDFGLGDQLRGLDEENPATLTQNSGRWTKIFGPWTGMPRNPSEISRMIQVSQTILIETRVAKMKEELRDLFDKAVKLRENGDLESAKNALLDLSQKDPNSAAILCVLGDVCWDLELREEAINYFGGAVGLSPKLEAASLGLF